MAIDLLFIGDVVTTLFAAIFFIATGIALGFMLGRRLYLAPLLEAEGELRRQQNEKLREQLLGLSPSSAPEAAPGNGSNVSDASEQDAERLRLDLEVQELRIELEGHRLEADVAREELELERRILQDEIDRLTSTVRILRGQPVAFAEAQLVHEGPDVEDLSHPSEIGATKAEPEPVLYVEPPDNPNIGPESPGPEVGKSIKTGMAGIEHGPDSDDRSERPAAGRSEADPFQPEMLLDALAGIARKLFHFFDEPVQTSLPST